jgi:hypothetical protein
VRRRALEWVDGWAVKIEQCLNLLKIQFYFLCLHEQNWKRAEKSFFISNIVFAVLRDIEKYFHFEVFTLHLQCTMNARRPEER